MSMKSLIKSQCHQEPSALKRRLYSMNNMAAEPVRKQHYIYIAPTPPAEMIDSSSYTIAFSDRKFLQVGLNPKDDFNVTVCIITPSRYISMSADYLNIIYGMRDEITLFLQSPPVKGENIMVYQNVDFNITKVLYHDTVHLVLESRMVDGCRVLLNNENINRLMDLQCTINSTISRKIKTRLLLSHQIDRIIQYADGKWSDPKIQQSNNDEIVNFIRSLNDKEICDTFPKGDSNYISELKNLAYNVIVDRWVKSWSKDMLQINEKEEEMCDENDGPTFFNTTVYSQENSYSPWASQWPKPNHVRKLTYINNL
ncbi:uncharacterized protein LOC126894069 [Daktulosphaira vitifoliae]|uniref:uncharacterized protein LOC126894069 n=1 Tax=Daktulosphaira vitifoliae TaxID=58002 RepID=UPI0021A97B79|nr:uncharacterized protein LOC126894069 [Daktulosphaira vitifoliae]